MKGRQTPHVAAACGHVNMGLSNDGGSGEDGLPMGKPYKGWGG